MSWVAMDDMVGAIYHALAAENLEGPVNVVSPNAMTNRELTKVLGRVLKRPIFCFVPFFLLRLKFGELADEALLASTRAIPSKLSKTGYEFFYPSFEGALRHVLGKT